MSSVNLGLVLFMFLVGLEVRSGEARQSARAVILTSLASIVAPFLCGGTLAWTLYPQVETGASRWLFMLFVGSAVSVTAFPVLWRILADRKLTNTRVGIIAISCAAVDDFTAWILLAIIAVLAPLESHNTPLTLRFTVLAFYILAMLFVIRPVLRRLIPTRRPLGQGWFGVAMIFLLVSVYATKALSVHAPFGAFLGGVVMPEGDRPAGNRIPQPPRIREPGCAAPAVFCLYRTANQLWIVEQLGDLACLRIDPAGSGNQQITSERRLPPRQRHALARVTVGWCLGEYQRAG